MSDARLQIRASMLRAELGCLADQIRRLEAGGIDALHFDVEDDGPSKSPLFGPAFIRGLRKYTKLPFDVHVRHGQPDRSVDQFVDAGADCLVLQLEMCAAPEAALSHIRDRGCQAGLAIYPRTLAASLGSLLDLCDEVNVMTVEPGRPGELSEEGVDTLRAVSALVARQARTVLVQADGAVSLKTRDVFVGMGANALVAGYPVFSRDDFGAAIAELQRGAPEHLGYGGAR